MSQPAGVEGQGLPDVAPTDVPVVQPTDSPPAVTSKPYDAYLEELPESVRPLVEPIFQKWDSGVTQRFQKLQEEYEPYQSWKPLVEAGAPPELAQQSLQLVQTLEANPEQVLQALAQAYNVELGSSVTPEPATPDPLDEVDEGPTPDPRLQQHEEMLKTMGNYLLQQQQEKQKADEDAALERTLTDLRTKHGDFNEKYVLALMAQGEQPEKAVEQFKADLAQFVADTKANNAPVVVGPGGGVPTTSVDPSTLGGKDTKALVIELLAAANQQT